jgi:polysaccharide pyruvyl transferase WcaK-like protein
MLPGLRAKKLKAKRFERFITNLVVSDPEIFAYPNDLAVIANQYDIFISGSDQIINKHSNELESEDWSAMAPYLLEFTERKKISYASSPANMTEEELMKIAPALNEFNALSAREKSSAELLEKVLKRDVTPVLDPTLLLDQGQWAKLADKAHLPLPEKYIVFYSLLGPRPMKKLSAQLKALYQATGYKIVIVTPFSLSKDTDWCIDGASFGPLEFLAAMRSASGVITDSYHGTLFSINFGVPFISISDGTGANKRKNQILEALSLTDHIVNYTNNFPTGMASFKQLDIDALEAQIQMLRTHSVEYLKRSLAD